MHCPSHRSASAFCLVVFIASGARPALAQTNTNNDRLDQRVAAPLAAPIKPNDLRPPVPGLFKPLAGDFKNLFQKDNLLLFGIGGISAVAWSSADNRAKGSTWALQTNTAFEPGKHVGSFLIQTGGALGTYAVGRAVGSPTVARVGSSLFRAQVVAQGTVQTIKFAVRRTRPDGTSLSFPSGHSASAFATATVLQKELGWKAGVPAYMVASWVAASRVQMKRHYVSDVIAGATAGILAGRSVTFGGGKARFGLSPVAVPGGAGVNITRIAK